MFDKTFFKTGNAAEFINVLNCSLEVSECLKKVLKILSNHIESNYVLICSLEMTRRFEKKIEKDEQLITKRLHLNLLTRF